jgi:hypothetical protein
MLKINDEKMYTKVKSSHLAGILPQAGYWHDQYSGGGGGA